MLLLLLLLLLVLYVEKLYFLRFRTKVKQNPLLVTLQYCQSRYVDYIKYEL